MYNNKEALTNVTLQKEVAGNMVCWVGSGVAQVEGTKKENYFTVIWDKTVSSKTLFELPLKNSCQMSTRDNKGLTHHLLGPGNQKQIRFQFER